MSEEWPSPLFEQGMELLEQQRYREARAVLCDALAECVGPGSAPRAAACLRWIGAADAFLENIPGAVDSYLRALELLAEYPMSELSLDCTELAGRGLDLLDRREKAIEYLRAASAGYGDFGEIECKAECDDALATALADHDLFADAMTTYRTAAEEYLAVDRRSDAADCRAACGEMAVELDEVVLARDEFGAARGLYDGIDGADAVLESAKCSFMIGLACLELDEPSRAEAEFLRARAGFESIGADEAAAECADRIGTLYAESGRIDPAVTALTTAAEGYVRHQRTEEFWDCLHRIALLHQRTGTLDDLVPIIASLHERCRAAAAEDLAAEVDLICGALRVDLGGYEEAARCFTRAREHYLRSAQPVEVAWCDTQLAITHCHLGDYPRAEGMLLSAIEIFEATSDDKRYATCQRYLGEIAFTRADLAQALHRFDLGLRYAMQAENWEISTECRAYLGFILSQSGEFERAIAELTRAQEAFDAIGQDAHAALCRGMSAMAGVQLNRYADAEVVFDSLREQFAGSDTLPHLSTTELHLGNLYLATGRFDEAEHAYRRSRDLVPATGVDESVAMLHLGLGNLSLGRGNCQAATMELRRAEQIFRQLGLPYQVAVCRQSLGAVAIRDCDWTEAMVQSNAAIEFFESDSAYQWNLGLCLSNIAIAETYSGAFESAREHLARARRIATELGTTVSVAKCDLGLACIAVVSSDAGEFRYALDLALPAMMYIDAQRFQFPYAARRLAWNELNQSMHTDLFDWVARLSDPSLMADLVEVSLNTGTHIASHHPPLAGALSADTAHGPDSSDVPAAAPTPGMRGAAMLIMGAALPMRPPPRLLMPDGRIALGTHIDSARTKYGGDARRQLVPTW